MSVKIYLDPGHGGSDPGAVGNGHKEAELVLAMCNYIAPRLRELGFEVIQSRTTNNIAFGPSTVYERGQKAAGCDFYLAVHTNSHSSDTANGCEVFPNNQAKASPVAALLQAYLSPFFNWRRIGGRNWAAPHSIFDRQSLGPPDYQLTKVTNQLDYYGFLRGSYATGVPGCLLETFFISNKGDVDTYFAHKLSIWEAIIEAVCEGLGGTYETPGDLPGTTEGEDDMQAFKVFGGGKINVQGFSKPDVDAVVAQNIPNGLYQVYESGMALANSSLKGALIRYGGKKVYVPVRSDATQLQAITVAEAESKWGWYSAGAADHSACEKRLAEEKTRADSAENEAEEAGKALAAAQVQLDKAITERNTAVGKFARAGEALRELREVFGGVG
ncbi:N-acetylmuramoyl-L-alanine amidase [Ruminococcaceae bacterium OttesenSCG-928-D13]|nr:N-acetylmuramoyl-L-alanine amidase [Ruminococcaceae bacterium OttesenSCG-928-D13]